MAKLTNNFRGGLADSAAGFTLLVALAMPGLAPAALLNNTINLPLITFNNQGTTTYDAATDVFFVDATPLSLIVGAGPPADITDDATGSRDFSINISVDAAGALIGGTPGDDLVVTGEVNVPGLGTISGVLLTGEVTGFGFLDSGFSTDSFDFSFAVTGGLLASLYPSGDLFLASISKQSSFRDDFMVNFDGTAENACNDVHPSTVCSPGPSTIPVPAAVWLFGTALIGLVGFSKRRKAA